MNKQNNFELLVTAIDQALEKIQELQMYMFVKELGLKYFLESAFAQLDMVKQGLKVSMPSSAEQNSFEDALTFLCSYIQDAKNIKNLLDQITGTKNLKDVVNRDKKLKERIVTYVKAIPAFLANQSLVQKSEEYVSNLMKNLTESNKGKNSKTKGNSISKLNNPAKKEEEKIRTEQEHYTEKDLTYFYNDLMNFMEVIQIQMAEEGLLVKKTTESGPTDLRDKKFMKFIGFYGERVNDKKSGKGKYYYLNGDFYDGEWKDDMKEGFGVYHFYAKDSKYQGEWKADKMHGKGTYFYADGSYYQGDWVEDKREGKGTFFFANGSRYEGEWRNDKMHGKGVFYYSDGSRYVGEWKNDQIHGKGMFYMPNGFEIEEEWRDGIKRKEEVKINKRAK